ncbi:MAG: hypothetical protein V1729_06295 [Candidatus Woesearchaeota archaeon]
MVVHESFITRRPLEFTLIVLFVLFIILLPVYFVTKQSAKDAKPKGILMTETYGETIYLFGQDSELSDNDKKIMFRLNYEGNMVQWTGSLLSCEDLEGLFKVSVDHRGNGFGDVLFTTLDDCTDILPGTTITYKTRLIDRLPNTFIGKEGKIIGWT